MSDKPVHEKAKTLGDLVAITMHPAFRIGFLDAQAAKPLDHDKIVDRIFRETPAGALKRLGWSAPELFDGPDIFGIDSAQAKRSAKSIEIAQYRYEEGRTLFLQYGVRCKAWGHPDFPPAQVREFCRQRYQQIMRGGEDDHDRAPDPAQPDCHPRGADPDRLERPGRHAGNAAPALPRNRKAHS